MNYFADKYLNKTNDNCEQDANKNVNLKKKIKKKLFPWTKLMILVII